MTPAAALLQDFLSRDATRIWSASGAVAQGWDRAVLAELARHRDAIRQATEGVQLGGMLRPNALGLAFALRKLDFVAEEAGCLCTLYPLYDMFLPAREAAEGHVDILELRQDPATWAEQSRCRCRVCGQVFAVREEAGGHYPWAVWTPEPDQPRSENGSS